MIRTLAVGAGGAIGAMARYLLGGVVHRYLPSDFPYGTFLINVTGCLAIGFLAALGDERGAVGPTARLFLLVGVLGGYTTFSSFGYETLRLVRDGSFPLAAVNVVGQVVLGLAAVWLGASLVRALP